MWENTYYLFKVGVKIYTLMTYTVFGETMYVTVPILIVI